MSKIYRKNNKNIIGSGLVRICTMLKHVCTWPPIMVANVCTCMYISIASTHTQNVFFEQYHKEELLTLTKCTTHDVCS